ncbi:hypothetical protein KSP40_PGU013825 [Platanthera guangdongensis]|uniref:Uncharacterized protein n=1 Tax=Platanthera guangdongensis TaxID=2320717 RepID=A0ABR2LSU4_9ASPA
MDLHPVVIMRAKNGIFDLPHRTGVVLHAEFPLHRNPHYRESPNNLVGMSPTAASRTRHPCHRPLPIDRRPFNARLLRCRLPTPDRRLPFSGRRLNPCPSLPLQIGRRLPFVAAACLSAAACSASCAHQPSLLSHSSSPDDVKVNSATVVGHKLHDGWGNHGWFYITVRIGLFLWKITNGGPVPLHPPWTSSLPSSSRDRAFGILFSHQNSARYRVAAAVEVARSNDAHKKTVCRRNGFNVVGGAVVSSNDKEVRGTTTNNMSRSVGVGEARAGEAQTDRGGGDVAGENAEVVADGESVSRGGGEMAEGGRAGAGRAGDRRGGDKAACESGTRADRAMVGKRGGEVVGADNCGMAATDVDDGGVSTEGDDS